MVKCRVVNKGIGGYVVQRGILGIWWDVYDRDGYYGLPAYDLTLEGAQEYVRMRGW